MYKANFGGRKHEIHSMTPTMYFRQQFKACTASGCSIRVYQSCTTQWHITLCPIAKNCANGETLCGKV